MAKVDIPIGFEFSGNGNEDLKRLVLSRTIGFAAHKTVLANLLETIAPIQNVNGVDVYSPYIEMIGQICDYESNHSEFLKRMVGADDNTLSQLCYIASDVDNLIFRWQRRFGFTSQEFRIGLQLLNQKLSDGHTIEIQSTMVKYSANLTKENPAYVPGGSEPEFIPWDYDDRVPVGFRYNGNTAFSIDNWYNINFWGNTYPTFNLDNDIEYRLPAATMSGDYLPNVKILNSSAVDITANFDAEILQAFVSMILINGSNFVAKTQSLTKVSEQLVLEYLPDLVTQKYYYYVTGTETWDCSIIQSFIDDVDGIYWKAHTIPVALDENDRYFPSSPSFYNEEIEVYSGYYGRSFWIFRDLYSVDDNIEIDSGGLFIKSGETTFLTVDGFRKCSDEQYATWILNMAYIYTNVDNSGCCGIGGFIGDILKGLVSIVGAVVLIVSDIFIKIAELAANVLFVLTNLKDNKYLDNLSEDVIRKAGEDAMSMALLIIGGPKLLNTFTFVLSKGIGFNVPQISGSKESKTKYEEEVNELLTFQSNLGSKEEFMTELKYNPFARLELKQRLNNHGFRNDLSKDKSNRFN